VAAPATGIVLTGASSGIGAALAVELARPGVDFLLLGRDAARLAAVAAAVRSKGAEAETFAVAVTDGAAMSRILAERDARRPNDLIIANAGVTSGREEDGPEPAGQAAWIVAVNLGGTLATVEPLLPAMLARRRGRIVLMCSIAALRPQADEPSYSAAKAGIRAWGLAMRPWLRAHNIAVTIVTPGFVTTSMSMRHHGPKPFEIDAVRAARIIARGIARGSPLIAFPWPLVLLVRLGNLLPPAISDWFERRLAARLDPDPRREVTGDDRRH
jgi:NADP-dependent 3-hydroxy acid dehydrogenase YdfG